MDYFLTMADMLLRIKMIEYRAMGIGDHAPLQMAVSLGPRPPGKEWRVKTWRLLNTKVAEDLEQVTQRYFTENTGWVQSLIGLWEAYKATVTGEIIVGEIAERWHREKRLAILETELIALDQRYTTHPTPDIKKQMNQTREEYNVVTWDEEIEQRMYGGALDTFIFTKDFLRLSLAVLEMEK
ncbi:hypothetical protein NDU88_005200 [Pleurodeles waltl]|uniref:Uncharacterized protein n=1 Tax=Pleurodeles waltl TaxID=8319 RepID=A0AAV7UKB0_PLEWA|nr:hypothetical protein NDU88_005200 [Pleurodeles waltl]